MLEWLFPLDFGLRVKLGILVATWFGLLSARRFFFSLQITSLKMLYESSGGNQVDGLPPA